MTQKFASYSEIQLDLIKTTNETSLVTYFLSMCGKNIEVGDNSSSYLHTEKAFGICSR